MDSFSPQRPDNASPDPVPPPPRRDAGAPGAEAEDVSLAPGPWLARNGIYLVLAAALLAVLFWRNGFGWVVPVVLVAVGLGLVIFFHELGHFAVAKWCDVYVQTFSIGFGPALPGCRVQWGETVYKIGLLPLGGYVQMLGEGTESEEDEDNPRSFRNKPVGQRMLIISAGVIMNVILAFLCFIVVFMGHGKERPAGVIGNVDPGNRAWEAGIPSGAELVQVGSRTASPGQPLYFTDLLSAVLNSTEGQKIPLAYETFRRAPDGRVEATTHRVEIEPRKGEKDDRPVIGVSFPESVEMAPEAVRKQRPFPYQVDSAAAAARRAFPWHPGDVVVAATDPDDPAKLTDLPRPAAGDDAGKLRAAWELSRRWYALAGKPLTLRVERQGGKVEEVATEPGHFDFGDTVIGTTDPEHPDNLGPDGVAALPPDPRDPGGKLGDFFELDRRLRQLAGRFLVIRVRRHDKTEEDLLVPPAYHLGLGTRMRIGPVTAVRDDSPAAAAGVVKGDILKEVLLQDEAGASQRFIIGDSGQAGVVVVDALRLPEELRRWADRHRGVKAKLTVVRTSPQAERERVTEALAPEVPWDSSWRFDRELPVSPSAPQPIPELGLAYHVTTVVEGVAPGSPADGRLQKNDVIKAVRYKKLGARAGEYTDGDWETLDVDQWPRWSQVIFQGLDSPEVTVRVERGGKTLDEPITLTLQPEPAWPEGDRGLLLMADYRLQKASNPGEALWLGLKETWSTICDVYLQLRGFLTGRISFKNAGGPIRIAAIAYSAASTGIWELLFFLGLISINLAVINFLPIPFLDGGHMVFLIYEKIRGRPARESVMAVATYAGLLLLLVVIVLVSYRDILWAWFNARG